MLSDVQSSYLHAELKGIANQQIVDSSAPAHTGESHDIEASDPKFKGYWCGSCSIEVFAMSYWEILLIIQISTGRIHALYRRSHRLGTSK